MSAEAFADEAIRPLYRSEYDQLVAAGVFDDERLELLDGRLVRMSPQGPRHAGTVQLLTDLLVRTLGDRAYVRPQLPIAASDLSEPEPDFAVVPRELFLSDHPTTALLVIEVAESSLRKDRNIKRPIYALAGVGEYWIVDLAARTVIVLRAPDGPEYREVTTYARGDVVTLAAFPEVTLAVDDFLPGQTG